MTHPVPKRAIEIFKSGGTLNDVIKAGILNTRGGIPAARTIRDWRTYVQRDDYVAVATTVELSTATSEDEAADYSFAISFPRQTTEEAPVPSRPSPIALRSAVFDIEVTSLQAGSASGYMICGCILPTDGSDLETYTISYEDRGDDERLLRDFLAALCQYDIIIGHNTHTFDINWLANRALYYGLNWSAVGRTWYSMDTFQMAKSLPLLWGKSLKALADFFAFEDGKLVVRYKTWDSINSPHREVFDPALREIAAHCQRDASLTRDLFNLLYGPSLSLAGPGPMKLTKYRVGIPDHVVEARV